MGKLDGWPRQMSRCINNPIAKNYTSSIKGFAICVMALNRLDWTHAPIPPTTLDIA